MVLISSRSTAHVRNNYVLFVDHVIQQVTE